MESINDNADNRLLASIGLVHPKALDCRFRPVGARRPWRRAEKRSAFRRMDFRSGVWTKLRMSVRQGINAIRRKALRFSALLELEHDADAIVAAYAKDAVIYDLAFVSALNRMRGEQGGEKQDMWFRATMCLAKSDGKRCTHEHASVAFHVDGTYRAAVDLRPQGFNTYKG